MEAAMLARRCAQVTRLRGRATLLLHRRSNCVRGQLRSHCTQQPLSGAWGRATGTHTARASQPWAPWRVQPARQQLPSLRRSAFTEAAMRRLQQVVDRRDEVSTLLQSADTPAEQMSALAQELGSLESTAARVDELLAAREALSAAVAAKQEADELIAAGDTEEGLELRELADEEAAAAQATVEELEVVLRRAMLPRDEADSRGVILEVRAGTGGDEAALFTAEMLRMYERFAAYKGWTWKVLDVGATEFHGVREAAVDVGGHDVFAILKYESGTHRVQRVPATESSGRLHTSAMTVAVLPEAEEVDVELRQEDLHIDTYRSSGKGGQSVNTTDSAVRIRHIPTGVVVAMQDERSQHMNMKKAMRVLRARLFDAARAEAQATQSAARKAQIGSGDRSERIRTYNYTQNRVTDHRIGLSVFGVEDVLSGGETLDGIIAGLRTAEEDAMLEELDQES